MSASPSAVDLAKGAVSAMPGGYLLAWMVGIPVEKGAAFFALLWSLGLIVQNWIWKPWIKPALNRRRVRREDAARRRRARGKH